LATNPSQLDTIELAHLEGERVMVEERAGWEVDGLEIKARNASVMYWHVAGRRYAPAPSQ
jgi:hypothetical protein